MDGSRIAETGPVAIALAEIVRLLDTDVAPGDKLPTERALAAQLGVGRISVRSALDRLEREGRVVRHVGRGTFATPSEAGSTIATSRLSPRDIITARLLIEPQVAFAAATAADGDDLEILQGHLAQGYAAETSRDFEEHDVALHHAVARAARNQVIVQVSELLGHARQQPNWGSLKQRSFNVENHRAYCLEHEEIVTAIRDRDAAAARAAMHQHLVHVRNILLP